MKKFENKKWISLLKEYNKAFSMVYDTYILKQEYQNDTLKEGHILAINNSVHNSMQQWFDQPIPGEMTGVTYASIIDKITTPDEIVELAEYAAVFCDDEIPDRIKIKLGSFGSEIIDKILANIIKYDWESTEKDNDEFDQRISSAFLKLLGDWECYDCHELIISKLCSIAKPHELIADAVRYYLFAIGNRVIPAIIARIEQTLAMKKNLDTSCEYLLITLTDIGRDSHDDRVFACLKNSFRKMKNKAIGAICLGDYGDGRGILTLRGWLDSHPDEKDRQIISETISAIKRLGGDISDIRGRLNLNTEKYR